MGIGSSFKKFLINILDFTINSHNIKTHILSTSNEIVSRIKTDVKNQLVSLKIDCVKCHHRSILGVNIQYTKDGKICLSTLAMVEMHEKHSAVNLKKMVILIYLLVIIKYNTKINNCINIIFLIKIYFINTFYKPDNNCNIILYFLAS